MQVPVHNRAGEVVAEIEVSPEVFGVPLNEPVLHQALVRQLANARQGTVDTKSRGEVQGSTRKLYRQKGTGRARMGAIRTPLRRGGGVAFGPQPRDHRQAMPKKMRRLALRSALSAKLAENELVVVEELRLEQPRTKEIVQLLGALGVDSSALVVTQGVDGLVAKSARNLPEVKALPAALLNIADLLSHRFLVMTVGAVRQVEEIWGKGPRQGEADATV